MRFRLGNGDIVAGWKALKAWLAVAGLCILFIAFLVGLFFLKSYRWGGCR